MIQNKYIWRQSFSKHEKQVAQWKTEFVCQGPRCLLSFFSPVSYSFSLAAMRTNLRLISCILKCWLDKNPSVHSLLTLQRHWPITHLCEGPSLNSVSVKRDRLFLDVESRPQSWYNVHKWDVSKMAITNSHMTKIQQSLSHNRKQQSRTAVSVSVVYRAHVSAPCCPLCETQRPTRVNVFSVCDVQVGVGSLLSQSVSVGAARSFST